VRAQILPTLVTKFAVLGSIAGLAVLNGCASLQSAATTPDTLLVQSAAEADRALQAQFGPAIAPYSGLLLERALEIIRIYLYGSLNALVA
jgi:anti-sigma factor RsiW